MARLIDFGKAIGIEYVAGTNIDDLCREAARQGVTDIQVDQNEMLIAAYFVAASSGNTNWGAEAIRTGRVDTLFGCKLTLI